MALALAATPIAGQGAEVAEEPEPPQTEDETWAPARVDGNPSPQPLPESTEPPKDSVELITRDFVLRAPSTEVHGDGVLVVPRGFVLTGGGRMISGNALRWDQNSGELFATGDVLMTLPTTNVEVDPMEQALTELGVAIPSSGPKDPLAQGIHIKAQHLGLKRLPQNEQGQALVDGEVAGRFPYQGEAWNVDIRVQMTERLVHFVAEKATFLPDRLVLEGVTGTGGHGSLFTVRSPKMVVGLREEVAEDREGFERHVADITIWQPKVYVIDVPVAWLPVLYRDFTYDYPWSRYEYGSSNRLGRFARAWYGRRLPDIPTYEKKALDPTQPGGVRRIPIPLETRAYGRVDHYTKAGWGYGALLEWNHFDAGDGRFLWYGMPNETVFLRKGIDVAFAAGPPTLGRFVGTRWFAEDDGRPPIITRSAHTRDWEHRFDKGRFAAYGRWVDIPDADPITPDVLDPVALYATPAVRGPTERFRNDYIGEHLESDPFARRGIAAAYTTPFASFVGDTEWKHHDDLDETERELGLQVTVPEIALVGPLHISANGWVEKLRRLAPPQPQIGATWQEAYADRVSWNAAFGGTQWFLDGFALDATGSLEGVVYEDARKSTWTRQAGYDPLYGNTGIYPILDQGRWLDTDDLGSARETDRIEVGNRARVVPVLEAGLSLRLEKHFTRLKPLEPGDPLETDPDAEPERERFLTHVITPRIGIEYRYNTMGSPDEDWVDLGFGDERDVIEFDKRYLTASVNSSLTKHQGRTLVSVDLGTKWALRDQERLTSVSLSPSNQVWYNINLAAYQSQMNASVEDVLSQTVPQLALVPQFNNFVRQELLSRTLIPATAHWNEVNRQELSDSRLVEFTGRLDIKPIDNLSLTGSFEWNGIEDRMEEAVFAFDWQPHPNVSLAYTGTWEPELTVFDQTLENTNTILTGIDPLYAIETGRTLENWQHQVGAIVKGNRYQLAAQVIMRPKGDLIDSWRVEVSRRFLDGKASLGYEVLRDNFGIVYDRNVLFTLTLYSFDLY